VRHLEKIEKTVDLGNLEKLILPFNKLPIEVKNQYFANLSAISNEFYNLDNTNIRLVLVQEDNDVDDLKAQYNFIIDEKVNCVIKESLFTDFLFYDLNLYFNISDDISILNINSKMFCKIDLSYILENI